MTISLFVKKLIGLKKHCINIEDIRTPFGEPFNENNHWIKTLKEYENGLNDYKKSSLYKFHQNFKPCNIFDISKDIDVFKNDFFLGEYPWGRWSQKNQKKEWKNSRHCGPTSDENIKKEWDMFIDLYKKIKSEGLNLERYGVPLGFFLIDEDNKKYFIVLGGNHRIAIISYLNLLNVVPIRMIARPYIEQFVYFNKLKIKYNRNGLDIQKTKKLFKNLISKEFINYEDY